MAHMHKSDAEYVATTHNMARFFTEHRQVGLVLPAALILFREFTVSALREVAAGKAVKLPVTILAKWKTTLQLVALGAELLVVAWTAFGLPPTSDLLGYLTIFAHSVLWLAALVTLITGAQYWEQARRALSDD